MNCQLNTCANAAFKMNEAYKEKKESLCLLFLKTLNQLPDEIGLLTHLKHLTVGHSSLTSIPTQIGLLINLKDLDFSNNKIIFLPTEIGLLTNLETLSLSHNELTSLPTQIGELTKLTRLSLPNNELPSLPTEIGRLTQITHFDCCINKLATLPETFWRLTEMVELSLNANKFASLSPDIGRMTKLVKVYLFTNKLTDLPAAMGQLEELTELHLFENKLTTLPANIKWKKLQKLGLEKNQFTSLPDPFWELTELTKLCLKENRLVSIAPQIGGMAKLTELDLSKNFLTSLPAAIGHLAMLKTLNLQKNELFSLPPEIGRLNELVNLSLENNPNLRELPLALGEMTALREIHIEGTAIRSNMRAITLGHCRQLRDRVSLNDLAHRLSKWQEYAEDAAPFTIELTLQQKYTLNEWLLRLESTRDFQIGQQSLAKLVWSILKDLHHQEFSDFFFTQTEENNVHCQDRTAMSLNEVYTSWVLLCKSPDLPKREKLNLLAGVAKTLRLRKALQFQIAHYEKARKRENPTYPGESESVEIFLYYETFLRDVLKLETAMKSMGYDRIGNRKWIDSGALIKDVVENFYEELIEIPLFVKMMQTQFDAIQAEFQAKLNGLGECPKGGDHDPQVLEYQVRVGELMQAWKRKKIEAAKNELST